MDDENRLSATAEIGAETVKRKRAKPVNSGQVLNDHVMVNRINAENTEQRMIFRVDHLDQIGDHLQERELDGMESLVGGLMTRKHISRRQLLSQRRL